MTNVQNALRSVLIYALAIPLALIFGYLLATRNDAGMLIDWSTWAPILVFLFVVCLPLLLKWHHPLLILSWNMSVVVFFLPGGPPLWFAMMSISLCLSILQRMLDRDMRFMQPPSLVWPLVFLTAVVFLTGHFTGGFGTRAFGGEHYGGRRYWFIFGAIAGFFALTAQSIPRQKALFFVGLFFLGGLADVLGSVIPLLPSEFYWLAAIFPVSAHDLGSLVSKGPVFGEVVARYFGLGSGCLSLFFFLLARFGIREMLGARTFWRLVLLMGVAVISMFGGFRSAFILLVLTFFLVFYFEGLFRTKYGAIFIGACILGSVLVVPLANKLPLPIQRCLTILPLDLNPLVRYEAQGSTEWRLRMWNVLLPEVPQYFWAGRGLAISGEQLELTGELVNRGMAHSEDLAMMAGDYHSGPFSVLIPFGVWGAIGWLWFLGASCRALYFNYRYGDESLRAANTLLLAYFGARTISFFVIFGDLSADLAQFVAVTGMSVCLNGGIRKPTKASEIIASDPSIPGTL